MAEKQAEGKEAVNTNILTCTAKGRSWWLKRDRQTNRQANNKQTNRQANKETNGEMSRNLLYKHTHYSLTDEPEADESRGSKPLY